MVKEKSVYFCTSCGNEFSRWCGQCSACKEWNTISKQSKLAHASHKKLTRKQLLPLTPEKTTLQPVIANQVSMDQQKRCLTHSSELDRVLGGGVVEGSVILIGGDPGVGKSTLLTQMVAYLSQQQKVLYISGEESCAQISQRCHRLSLPQDKLWLLTSTNIADILHYAHDDQPTIMVIDSIQTMYSDDINSAAGSVTQVRACCAQLIHCAKNNHCAIFVIGHVTKDGHIAGPRILEHMVDTVLYLEGESDPRYRILRAIKNRFGAVNEIAVFAMTDKGMKQVSNPSAIFLTNRNRQSPGSVAAAIKEGTRPLLIEIQALFDTTSSSHSKRLALGIDYNRLSMLLAIMHRHIGISTYEQDCYINIVGGLKIQETATDLAIILALYSSYKNDPLPLELIVFGEVGLTGEVRPVADGEARLFEAEKQGFTHAIIPLGNVSKTHAGKKKIQLLGVKSLTQAITCLDGL